LPIETGSLPNGDQWLLAGWILSEKPLEELLLSYKSTGIESLYKADGEFVLILYSQADDQIEILRDRTGIIPIAYAKGPKGIALSTWIDNVFDYTGLMKFHSEALLQQYPVYRLALVPDSPFNGVKYLSGRCSLIVSGHQIFEKESPLPVPSGPGYRRMEHACTDLGECLSSAVKKRVQNKGNIGAWLSGGNDSSLMVALIRTHYSGPVRTFFVTFEDYERNYEEYALTVARKYETDHSNFKIGLKEYLNNWAETIAMTQTPVNHPGSIGQTAALQQASGFVDVMLAGEGADSVFGGPYWAPMVLLSFLGRFLPKTVRDTVRILAGTMHDKPHMLKVLKKLLTSLGTPLKEYVLVGHAFGDEKTTDSVFSTGTWRHAIDTCAGNIHEHPLDDLILFLMLDWFPATIGFDMRRGFHYGLTFRYPFFDYELLRKSLQLPLWLRYNYKTKKAPLKRYALNYFDHDFVYKPKEGLGVPLGKWLSRPEFATFLHLPLEERSLKRGWWSEKVLRPIIEFHKSGFGNDESAETIPWIVMNLELWARICLEGDSPDLYKIRS
jgi:asparagine synthase (glutamine-hydrolysing)